MTRIRPIDDGIVPDTSSFTTPELFAYYKRTAPRFDVEFWIKNASMPDALRRQFRELHSEILYTNISRPEVYRRFATLKARWGKLETPRELFKRLQSNAVDWINAASREPGAVIAPIIADDAAMPLRCQALPDDAYRITRELVQAARAVCPRKLASLIPAVDKGARDVA